MDARHISILPNEMLLHIITFLPPSAAFMLKCTATAFGVHLFFAELGDASQSVPMRRGCGPP
jgi:hypothetical protein